MAKDAKADAQKSATQWRGRAPTAGGAADHAWQADRGQRWVRRTHRRAMWRKIRVAVFFLLGIAGGVSLLSLLLHREVQPPFIAVVKTANQSPLPPNAWASEDLESFRSATDALDGRTVDLVDLSEADRTKETILLPSLNQRRQLVRQARRMGVIIFYVSMHGLVDHEGNPSLAAPDAAATDSRGWLPFSQVLRQIQEWNLPDEVHKLLILDCNRMETNWSAGLLRNSFTSRLHDALEATPVANLVILNSTDSGEVGWSAPETRGTVFGQFLRLGLAGAADLAQAGGNNDRRVSLHELHRYLLRTIDEWAVQNRGVHQRPALIPAGAADFGLTCTLDPRGLQRALARFANEAGADPAIPRADLDELWTALAELINRGADHVAPLEMSELRHKLLWVEQAASAGEAYRAEAHAAQRDCQRLADRLRERIGRAAPGGPGGPDGASPYSDVWFPGLASKLRSLALLAKMGRLDQETIEGLYADLHRLPPDSPFENLEALNSEPQTGQIARQLGIVHFLKLVRQSRQAEGPSTAPASLEAALEMQFLSDNAAVPADPRAHYWLKQQVEKADAARRLSEDAVLAGEVDAPNRDSAIEGYRAGAAIDAAVHDAIVLCDEVAAELPYLAKWIDSAARDGEGAGSEETATNLLAVIHGLHVLSANLDQEAELDSAIPAGDLPFAAQFRDLELKYAGLRGLVDAAYERLLAAGEPSPQRVREAAELLAVPLFATRANEAGLSPLQQRHKLHAVYTQFSRDLNRRSMERILNPSTADGSGPAGLAGESADSTAHKSPKDHPLRHPLLALLEPAEKGAPAAARADSDRASEPSVADDRLNDARMGGRVRRILRTLPDQIEEARSRHLASHKQIRNEWSRAARLARTTAAYVYSAWQIDPIPELRRVDIQQLLFWHAKRASDDFWGPAARGEPAFFEAAAKDALEAAELIAIANPAAAKQVLELRSALESRRHAARQGLVVRAEAVLLAEALERPVAHVHVTGGPDGAARGMPAGNAVLRVADDRGNMLGKAAGVSVALAAGDQAAGAGEQSISLSSARELADTIGTATALFRGHEFHDDLVIKTASGTTVESRPGRLHSAKIRLNGNRRQRAAVVFVLDCSFSMRQEMLFEGADARVPRLEVAKAALGRMLNALAARGDARVGVILYGHRIGWSTKEQNQLLTQTSYAGRIPEGLKPYEDVETVLPLGRFDAVAAAGVIERLDRVKPWGESPLYLALTQALQEFKDDDLDAQRSVVVITDGLNYQFNPRSEKAKAARDVLAADSLRGIPLHIVGFGIQPEEERQTQREFGQLAGETGGHFVNVAEAASLAESLEDILQARQYAVSTAAGKTQRARIGSAVEIEWADDGPQECLVSIDALSEPVEVAGGEALELFVSQDGQKIVSAVYDAGSPVFAALVGGPPRDPKGIRLGVHQPSREGSTVIFDLSLQHLQQHFVSRPREVWAEISPVLPDNRPAANLKYVFYDPEFVPRTAVPVLRAAARNWPKAARRARIDFWCKWSATEPSRLVAFADAPDGNQAAQSGTLEAIPGFKYQMRTRPGAPWRVDFIEIYPSDAAGATMLKIDVAGRVQPTRILRQFDDVNHFATHSFLFDDPAPELIRSTDSIRIVTRRRMFDDAQRLEILVSIEVPEQADTIPSFPPAN